MREMELGSPSRSFLRLAKREQEFACGHINTPTYPVLL